MRRFVVASVADAAHRRSHGARRRGGGAIVTVGLHLDGPDTSVVFAATTADAASAIDALEGELNAA